MDVLKDNTKPKLAISGTIKQNFCLPSTITYYITKNPSTPKCYQKLIQCCKHFFVENPLLIVRNLYRERICPIGECQCFIDCSCKFSVTIDIKKCLSKIWLLNNVGISKNAVPNFASILCSKLYHRSEVTIFMTISTISIDFNDFKILASTATDIRFYGNAKIIHKNAMSVTLEEIVEAIPNIQNFVYGFSSDSSMITASSMKKSIHQFQNLKNLRELYLIQIPEALNVEDLSKFIKDKEKTLFYLNFASNISEAYKNQLDALTDTMIESKLPGRYIDYPDMNIEKKGMLHHTIKQWREMYQL